MSRISGRMRRGLVALVVVLGPAIAVAIELPRSAVPPSLATVPVPMPPGLLEGPEPIVVDHEAAILLGKALFWEQNVGSDRMACASCHFHAGADARTRNQLGPGLFHDGSPHANTFEPLISKAAGGPNHTLRLSDFPLRRLLDPTERSSRATFDSDDVVSSSGTIGGEFRIAMGGQIDYCTGGADPIFHVNGVRTRRVEPRHTPTVINAAFYFRNFWDGRANFHFNGQTRFGPRDEAARVFVLGADGVVRPERLSLPFASLASQAVGPPINDREMACTGRGMADVGRKVLPLRALYTQAVHPEDSVLAPERHASGIGLRSSYRDLVRRSFHPRFWAGTGSFGRPRLGPAFSQMEANFALFFGLSIQLYEATLISDDAPFDRSRRDENGVPIDLDPAALRGLDLFVDQGHCAECHSGAEFTGASVAAMYAGRGTTAEDPLAGMPQVVDRIGLSGGDVALVDRGFFNTGIRPTAQDLGVHRRDPFGNPFSFAEQYAGLLAGRPPVDAELVGQVTACGFDLGFTDFSAAELSPPVAETCASPSPVLPPRKPPVPGAAAAVAELAKPDGGRLSLGTRGAMKVPTLRNVELTGPYMHNGGLATLEQVIAFYDRGGNLSEVEDPELHPFVHALGLTAQDRADLVAFLRTLTDERVRWERAPFDHPALRVPHGHVEDGAGVRAGSLPGRSVPVARDLFLDVPAVGRHGRTAAQGALLPFEARVAP